MADDCTKITPLCPVEDTVYGYYPSLAANAIFVALFAICAVAQIVLGIKYRLRLYTIVVFIGCAGEAVGYVGRIMMHSNPWNSTGFIIQILLLIVSPSFLAAGLYLTVKHLVLHFGPQYSRLRPRLYTWLFITCDAIGFVTQMVGGGIQASASDGRGSSKTLDVGNSVMITGIAFQAATMAVCGILAVDYTQRLYRRQSKEEQSQRVPSLKGPRAFTFYMCCTTTAFVTILIRCIYRIPEMAGGWGNELMRNEAEFMILDGCMIAVAAILMTVAFPGAYFPSISNRASNRLHEPMNETEEALHLHPIQAHPRST
ncbi:RTA1 like protein-domain-containing protein [Bisporella sp. PMI_857]|nr:RTA1 like protein-domain-containing protein [Bisporella sp. PMI_857]